MKTLSVALLVSVLSSQAFAGGPTVAVDDPLPTAAPASAPAHDWSGPYAGLSYGTAKGDVVSGSASPVQLDDGSLTSIYIGTLVQRGNFVWGGELAYGSVSGTTYLGFVDSRFDKVLDLKGRVGFAANRALFYGVIGYSSAPFVDASTEYDTAGLALGLGADFAVSDRVTVGLEYLTRDLSGGNGIGTMDASLDTLSLRVGLSF